MSKSVDFISDETIKKALETLGISTTDNINKGEDNDIKSDEKEIDEEVEGKKEKVEKSDNSKEKEKEEDEEEIEKAFEKNSKELEELEKACQMKKSEIEAISKKRKKLPDELLEKSQVTDIIKSELDTRFDAVTTLLKTTIQENQELKKSLVETNEILGKVSHIVTDMGNQSLGRKSYTTSKAIEKSFNNDINQNNGKKVLSLSRDRQELENTLLDLSNIEKGEINSLYANAAMLFNTSKTLDRSTINDLYTSKNIQIVD